MTSIARNGIREGEGTRRRARMKKLIVLVGLAMVAVVAFEALDVSDAEARKRRPPPPPNYNVVLCVTDQRCGGTPSADIMVGAAGTEILQGAAGNDIYMGSAGASDYYIDGFTSSDLYGGFLNGQFDEDEIRDGGGVDRVDLSTNTSAYASTDFTFFKGDGDGDGAEDDLQMNEVTFGGSDDIYVLNHFGSGRIEYIKFSDKTLSGANLPLS
jgi:hypothetical protein